MSIYSSRLAKAAIYILCSLSLFMGMTGSAHAEKMQLAFINPSYPNEPFWSLVTGFMEAAAKDLNIELQVYYAENNRFKSLALAQDILKPANKPDYLVFLFQAQIGTRILQAAEEAKVHSFVINTDVPDLDAQDIGEPRGKYQYWLGHMMPDDQSAGYILAAKLIDQAILRKKIAEDGKIHMIGLTGSGDNTASVNRNMGVRQYVDERSDIILHQIVDASWDKEKAATVTHVLMKRYPQTSVIWSASDNMALGAIQALEDLGLQAGKDVLIGGVDGTLEGLKAVKAGKMLTTMSGHFIEGAWAMVLLYDHFHGIDFKDDLGSRMYSNMEAIQLDNSKQCLEVMSLAYISEIDFKPFSKVFNPNLQHYQFHLPDTLLLTQ